MTKACLSVRERSPALSLPYFGLSLAKPTTFKPSPWSSFTFSPPQACIPKKDIYIVPKLVKKSTAARKLLLRARLRPARRRMLGFR